MLKKMMFMSSEKKLLLLEQAALCERSLTFSKRTIQNFPLLSSHFSFTTNTRKRLFSVPNSAIKSRPHICSINFELFSRNKKVFRRENTT